jgi:hypothetical protein
MTAGQIVFLLLASLVGCGFAWLGFSELYVALRLLRSGVRTEAIFAGWETREGWEDVDGKQRLVASNYPIFEFADVDGRRQRVTLQMTSSGFNFKQGNVVRILYDPRQPSQPETFRIATFEGLWLWCVIGLTLGFVGLGAAFFVWYANVPVRLSVG